MMTIGDAIDRSISHDEIVHVTTDATYSQVWDAIHDHYDGYYDFVDQRR